MRAERTRSAGLPAHAGPHFIRTRSQVAVCVVCGHEQAGGAACGRLTCPDCGATVRTTVRPADGVRQ